MNNIINFMKNYNVASVLDIGANVGTFSETIRNNISHIELFMIEANPFCESFLLRSGIPYIISCLSDKETFTKIYINKNNSVCTGTSYYKETTDHYKDAEYVNVNTSLLDNVIMSRFGDYKSFDYIKMDTQGSELDIIRGGMETINRAKFIQIELSLIEYNAGAPTESVVIDFMKSIGFKPTVLVEKHYWNQDPNDKLIQEDWIFTR